jgi:hydrogenase maturation protease
MSHTLVLGIGNLIQSDDGVGIHAVRRLRALADLPDDVEVIDGGTMGLELLHCLEGVGILVVVDAVDSGLAPGTLIRMTGDQVPAYLSLKMSPHQIGLPDLLFAAKLRDLYPRQVVIWGIQPATIEMGLELSPAVVDQVDALVQEVLKEIAQWEPAGAGWVENTHREDSSDVSWSAVPDSVDRRSLADENRTGRFGRGDA